MRVVVGMATTAKRLMYAELAIKSLEDQVDEIHLWNNDTEDANLFDNGKFVGLDCEFEECYYFTCDDDIIYPPTYVQDMIKAIEFHKCIVTHHGRKLKGTGIDYYSQGMSGHYGYRCLSMIPRDTEIDVCGSGCTAFSTVDFNPLELYRSKDLMMADLVLSLEAAKQGKKIMVLSHDADYFRDLKVPKGLTIYEMQKENHSRQNEIADEIYKLKHN